MRIISNKSNSKEYNMAENGYIKRKMGLDVGDARIGVAFSDLLGVVATGYETFHRTKNVNADLKYLAALAQEKECDAIVVGLPLNMDGSSGERVQIVKQFCEKLEKYTELDIIYQDERLSTVSAENMLLSDNVRREDRKKVIDKVAASLILQVYLDKQKNKGAKKMDEVKNDVMENEDEAYIITFEDEEGNKEDYEVLAELDYDNRMFAVVQPVEFPDDMSEDEVIICEITVDESGDEIYDFLDDDELADKVVEEYNKMADEEE